MFRIGRGGNVPIVTKKAYCLNKWICSLIFSIIGSISELLKSYLSWCHQTQWPVEMYWGKNWLGTWVSSSAAAEKCLFPMVLGGGGHLGKVRCSRQYVEAQGPIKGQQRKRKVDGGEVGREVGATADPPPPTCKSKTGVTISSLHLEPGFRPAELPAALGCAATLHITTFCSSMLCPISFFIGRKCSPFPRKMMAAVS